MSVDRRCETDRLNSSRLGSARLLSAETERKRKEKKKNARNRWPLSGDARVSADYQRVPDPAISDWRDDRRSLTRSKRLSKLFFFCLLKSIPTEAFVRLVAGDDESSSSTRDACCAGSGSSSDPEPWGEGGEGRREISDFVRGKPVAPAAPRSGTIPGSR